MTDVFSKKKRSEVMSKIRGKDTKMEIAFRKALWAKGFRYSKNSSKYFGKPDLVLKKYETVIFLDSCFWHGCKKHFQLPAARRKFWKEKIARNKQRDKEVNRHYGKISWKVFIFWEHEIAKDLHKAIEKILEFIIGKM